MQSSCGIIDDIEDILKQDQLEDMTTEDFDRSNNKSFILPKSLKRAKLTVCPEGNEDNDEEELQRPSETSNVPGLASIYVKTWGCTHNGSDGEYMAGQLAAYGYKLVGK